MYNYRILIQYDGGRFDGWQRLGKDASENTVEFKIKEILKKMTGEEAELFCGCRTEKGVHAYGQVANFKLNSRQNCMELRNYLNRYLPADICALDVAVAGDRFHARLNATGKVYEYTLYVGAEKPVFDRNYVWCVPQGSILDVDVMKKAASYLVGKHDFRSFCGNNKMKKSTVRTIYDITIAVEEGYLRMSFYGNGFLQNMVRILTGTLLEVGYGRKDAGDMEAILAACDRQTAGPTAPPYGLTLLEVEY